LGLDEKAREKHAEERESQDKVLAMLFLKATLADLNALRFLPDVLEYMNLPYSRMALLYALGYEELLREEGFVPAEETSEALLSTFKHFMQQPAVADLPARPTGLESGTSTLVSPILGTRLVIKAEADFESLRLAERLLAGCEALFSTSLDAEIFPYREELTIKIVRAKNHQGPPTVTKNESTEDALTVMHDGSIADGQSHARDWFFRVLTSVLVKLVLISSPESYLKRVFGEEAGLGRALNFTESAVTMANVLGRQPKTRLSDWNMEGSPKAYFPKKETLWHGDLYSEKPEDPRVEPLPGVGDIPGDLINQTAKHTERRVASVIDIPVGVMSQ
jgi:hypothetical protein